MRNKPSVLHSLIVLAAAVVAAPAALAAPAQEAGDGVNVGRASALRKLVPAENLERQAAAQYLQLKQEASSKKALVPDNHPQVQRLRSIAARIVPHATRFNARASSWKWEVSLINAPQINAFCMPGGKIAFYTGILEQLKLTDDEVAAVMGHEMAHALREHARERIAKTELTRLGTSLLGEFLGGGRYTDAFALGGNLLTLKFSRDDESESDVIGLDLAARAGFDPRAGITLWEKMAAANKGAPPQWLSTHPSGSNRIEEMRRHLPAVMPLYERSRTTGARPQ